MRLMKGWLPAVPMRHRRLSDTARLQKPSAACCLRLNGRRFRGELRHDWHLTRPGKMHPAASSFSDILALDQGAGLLEKHGEAHVGDMLGAKFFDKLEGPAGDSDVVHDEELGSGNVNRV